MLNFISFVHLIRSSFILFCLTASAPSPPMSPHSIDLIRLAKGSPATSSHHQLEEKKAIINLPSIGNVSSTTNDEQDQHHSLSDLNADIQRGISEDVERHLNEHKKNLAFAELFLQNKRTKLFGAIWAQDFNAATQLLRENQAAIRERDLDGRSVLMVAAMMGNVSFISTLVLEFKADVNEKMDEEHGGSFALLNAAEKEKWETCQWLLELMMATGGRRAFG